MNNLYIHDALTGLLNRRGYENATREMYNKSIEQHKSMVIFSIDMDNLKIVNDQFGHAQGDLALKTIANAMEYAVRKREKRKKSLQMRFCEKKKDNGTGKEKML